MSRVEEARAAAASRAGGSGVSDFAKRCETHSRMHDTRLHGIGCLVLRLWLPRLGVSSFQAGQVPETEKAQQGESLPEEFSFAGDGTMEKVFTQSLKELQQNAKVLPVSCLSHSNVEGGVATSTRQNDPSRARCRICEAEAWAGTQTMRP